MAPARRRAAGLRRRHDLVRLDLDALALELGGELAVVGAELFVANSTGIPRRRSKAEPSVAPGSGSPASQTTPSRSTTHACVGVERHAAATGRSPRGTSRGARRSCSPSRAGGCRRRCGRGAHDEQRGVRRRPRRARRRAIAPRHELDGHAVRARGGLRSPTSFAVALDDVGVDAIGGPRRRRCRARSWSPGPRRRRRSAAWRRGASPRPTAQSSAWPGVRVTRPRRPRRSRPSHPPLDGSARRRERT